MRKFILLVIFSVLSVSPAFAADDWAGKPVTPNVTLPLLPKAVITQPSYVATVTVICETPSGPNGFSEKLSTGKTCPAGSSFAGYAGLQPNVPSGFNTSSKVTTTPSGITAPGSTVSILVGGTFPDATSPTGIDTYLGDIPLADFATTSTVDALEAEMNQLKASVPYLKHYAAQGTAQALAMAGVGDIDPDQKVSISMNFGSYEGQSAAALGLAVRVNHNASFNAGTSGMGSGTYGVRAGFRIGW